MDLNFDESIFDNLKLFNFKREIIKKKINNQSFSNDKLAYQFSINYHKIPTTFYFSSKLSRDKYESFFSRFCRPCTEGTDFKIFLHSIDKSRLEEGVEWDDEIAPECEIFMRREMEIAIQRDFIGIYDELKKKEATIFFDDTEEDGFFNAMRWLLPRKMLSVGKIILHSSCIVDKKGRANFFLGPSGAGKSTIASLAGDRIILGDDMNILGVSQGGEIYAEAGALGGLFDSSDYFGRQFPVANFFWLQQANFSGVSNIDKCSSQVKIVASCANMFWPTSKENVHIEILKLINEVLGSHSVRELYFQLNQEFWQYVDRC